MNCKFLFLIFVLIVSVYTQQQNIQSRYAGKVHDIKYFANDKYGNLVFWITTDNARDYYFSSSGLPYIEVGDSLIEYWIEFQLRGIGNCNSKFFYNVLK